MLPVILLGIAALGVLILSIFTREQRKGADTIALSVCLCGSWLTTKMIAHAGAIWLVLSPDGDWDAARAWNAPIDAFIVTVAVVLSVERVEAWKVGFVSTIVAKLGIDLAYAYVTFRTGIRPGSLYQWLENTGYGLELFFLALAGGLAVADRYREPRSVDRLGGPGHLPALARWMPFR